jgi:hypothetical protein
LLEIAMEIPGLDADQSFHEVIKNADTCKPLISEKSDG